MISSVIAAKQARAKPAACAWRARIIGCARAMCCIFASTYSAGLGTRESVKRLVRKRRKRRKGRKGRKGKAQRAPEPGCRFGRRDAPRVSALREIGRAHV